MTVQTMRAMGVARFGEPQELTTMELPRPQAGPGAVLIHIAAAAVNPADLGMRAGRYRWAQPVRFPLVPGYDVAGHVVEVGEGVTGVTIGDPVIANTGHSLTQAGGYAEFVALPARYVAAAPTGVDLVAAAGLPLAALTALQVTENLELAPGSTVVVNGPVGAVGGFVAQFAARRGAVVVAAVRERDVEYARALGVSVIVDRDRDLAEAVRERFPDGVDAAVDVVGGPPAVAAFAAVHDHGRYSTVVPTFWVAGGPTESSRGITPRVERYDPDNGRLGEVSQLVSDGRLLPTRVGRVLPLSEARQAHELLQAGGVPGKVVLKLG
jgi:NADPH2:quinone reductase